MDINKINEELKPNLPPKYNPSKRYGVMGICLGYDLHEKLHNYAKKRNLKMSQIIRLLVKSYLDEMEEK